MRRARYEACHIHPDLEGIILAHESYWFAVGAEDEAAADRCARALADVLGEADGVLEAVREKINRQTMDLGTIVSVIADSGATLAIAQGLAVWLRQRRGATVTVERDGKAGSVKAAVAGLDPEAAVRIIEMIREGQKRCLGADVSASRSRRRTTNTR